MTSPLFTKAAPSHRQRLALPPEAGLLLNQARLRVGVDWLAARDPDLRAIVQQFSYPPLWAREPNLATLVHIILEQQVSLASALAAFKKLQIALGSLTPIGLLQLSDVEFKTIGFSRQKTHYARCLANAIAQGALDLARLPQLTDDEVRAQLQQVKGIGRWTADIFLLMALRRPDVWPHGDLALAKAAHEVKGLAARPDYATLAQLATQWHPYRAVAARLLWHHYLST